MPLKTWNTKADFDAAYRIGAEPEGHINTRPEVKLNYHRAVMLPVARNRAAGISKAMGWAAPDPTIVVFGSGFSWLCEALEELGFTAVVGIDTSTYIQQNKATSEESDIDSALLMAGADPTLKTKLLEGGVRVRASRGVLNEDASTKQSKDRIKSSLGLSGAAVPSVIVSESVIESLTDSEFLALSDRLRSWVPSLIHFVVTFREGNQDGFNWKTLEAWKLLSPLDTFIEAGTYRVL